MRPIEQFDFQHLIFYRLRRLLQLRTEQIESMLARGHALRIFDWRVLGAVHRYPGSTASFIGPKVLLDKMQTSRSIARLVRLGLVKEAPHQADGRAIALTLTAKGAKAFAVTGVAIAAAEMHALAKLNATELAVLDQLLKKIEGQVLDQAVPELVELQALYEAGSDAARADYLFDGEAPTDATAPAATAPAPARKSPAAARRPARA